MDPANRSINFQLRQGTNKFNVSLPASALISNVMEEAEKLTKIPASSQKLIVNGKALTTLDHTKIITDCRIQDGTKVMVLGKKYDIDTDVMYQKIVKVEENIVGIQKKLSEVTKEVKDIEDGFLSKEHHNEALKGLTKRCKLCIEEFMGTLEALDELQFEEHQSIAKAKRKSVVKEANNHLDLADEILKRIETLISN